MTRVTVILPVKDDPPVFRAVWSVLASASNPEDLEFLVVDNGSTPAFRRELDALPAPVRVLDESMPGPAAARNHAVDMATGDILFFIDADCIAHDGWLRHGLEGFERTGAEIVAGASPTLPAGKVAAFQDASINHWPVEDGGWVHTDTKNVAVRRHVFEKVRFDSSILRYEDAAFGLAAVAAGFRVAFWPEMLLEHETDESMTVVIGKEIGNGWARRHLRATRPKLWGKEVRASRRRRRTWRTPWEAIARVVGEERLARGGVATAIMLGRLFDRAAPVIPVRVGGWVLATVRPAVKDLGSWMYDAGFAQASYGQLLRGEAMRRAKE